MSKVGVVLGACLLASVALASDEAQPFPRDESGHVRFIHVVQAEGTSASELYARAKFWAAKAFVSARNVIQPDDQTSGRLVLKGATRESYGLTGDAIWFHFTLTIELKDGRYRWAFDQGDYAAAGGAGRPIEALLTKQGVGTLGLKAVFERFRKDVLALGANLEAAMAQPASSKDIW